MARESLPFERVEAWAARVGLGEFLRPVRHHEAQGLAGGPGPPGEMPEQLERARVGRVQIVEDDQDGRGLGEVAEQSRRGPEEPLPLLLGAAFRATARLPQRREQRGQFGVLGAGPGALGRGPVGEPPVERLDERPERRVPLRVVPRAPQHGRALARRP